MQRDSNTRCKGAFLFYVLPRSIEVSPIFPICPFVHTHTHTHTLMRPHVKSCAADGLLDAHAMLGC